MILYARVTRSFKFFKILNIFQNIDLAALQNPTCKYTLSGCGDL